MSRRHPFGILLLTACLSLVAGCSVIDVHVKIDPAGGALTDSLGYAYDFDRAGVWYVVFIREEGLIAAVHRHNPGIHMFLDKGDMVFYCRCSGRGEVIDVMGQMFQLKRGSVFLCEVDAGTAKVRQLEISPAPCDGYDPKRVARSIDDLSGDARVAAFLGLEGRARLRARSEIEQGKHGER